MNIIDQAQKEAPDRTDEELDYCKKSCSTYMVDILKKRDVPHEELMEAKRVSNGVFKVINAEIAKREEDEIEILA